MVQILTSLHGRKVGLGPAGTAGAAKGTSPLVVPGGLVSGDHGNQLAMPSPSKIVLFDDFIGDAIADQWDTQEGTDSATSAPSILAGGIGGVLRLTTGDAGTGLAADMIQVTQALQWQASNGGLAMQVRLKLSAITTCYVFVGFTDLAASLEAPIESAASANTLTSNATDAVGFMFDTRMTDDNWWLVGVANDVDATHQDTGVAPVAADYETLRVEVSAGGVATFFRNGLQVGTAMTGAVTAGTDLTPTLNASKTSVAASMTVDFDYVGVEMNRAADGDAT
jgi:hypothetical protein